MEVRRRWRDGSDATAAGVPMAATSRRGGGAAVDIPEAEIDATVDAAAVAAVDANSQAASVFVDDLLQSRREKLNLGVGKDHLVVGADRRRVGMDVFLGRENGFENINVFVNVYIM